MTNEPDIFNEIECSPHLVASFLSTSTIWSLPSPPPPPPLTPLPHSVPTASLGDFCWSLRHGGDDGKGLTVAPRLWSSRCRRERARLLINLAVPVQRDRCEVIRRDWLHWIDSSCMDWSRLRRNRSDFFCMRGSRVRQNLITVDRTSSAWIIFGDSKHWVGLLCTRMGRKTDLNSQGIFADWPKSMEFLPHQGMLESSDNGLTSFEWVETFANDYFILSVSPSKMSYWTPWPFLPFLSGLAHCGS